VGVATNRSKRHIASMSALPGANRKTRRVKAAVNGVYYIWTSLIALTLAILLLRGIIALVAPTGSAESLFGNGYPLASILGSVAFVVVGTPAIFVLIDKWCRKGSTKKTL
jgi:hypothetical protein